MMDKSKEFIAMADCPEIQDKMPDWESDDNSLFYKERHGIFYGYELDTESTWKKYLDDSNIKGWENSRAYYKFPNVWLPRQDELQEMTGHSLRANIKLFNLFCMVRYHPPEAKSTGTPFAYFDSMEQLLLALVMQEKFKKRWDGDKWVSDSD